MREDFLVLSLFAVVLLSIGFLIEGCTTNTGIQKASNCSAKFEYKCTCDNDKNAVNELIEKVTK